MVSHIHLGPTDAARRKNLARLIRNGSVTLAGYRKSRIFGTLDCPSGKRMKTENRVFFSNEEEARSLGYRPCGRCMPAAYAKWKVKQQTDGTQPQPAFAAARGRRL